jgi:excisionase family DNA binding protein
MGEKKSRELWDMKQLLEYLKIPRSTAFMYISTGKIPSVKIGRHRRFIPEEVERALRKMPA